MAKYTKIISVNDFNNNEYVFKTKEAETLYIRSENIASYNIKSCLGEQQKWSDNPLIRLSDFNIVNSIDDNNIYITDVSGFDYIKIIIENPQNDGKIFLKVVGELWT